MTYDEINLYHDMSWCNQKEGGRIFVTINGGAHFRLMCGGEKNKIFKEELQNA